MSKKGTEIKISKRLEENLYAKFNNKAVQILELLRGTSFGDIERILHQAKQIAEENASF